MFFVLELNKEPINGTGMDLSRRLLAGGWRNR